jgi:acyl carrier protein
MKISRTDVIEVIRQANIMMDPNNIRDDIKLTDQGVDSLGVFSFILALQEKYSIEIPDADIDRLTNVQQIMDYLNSRLS